MSLQADGWGSLGSPNRHLHHMYCLGWHQYFSLSQQLGTVIVFELLTMHSSYLFIQYQLRCEARHVSVDEVSDDMM